jgi:hypothetical protein
MTTKGFGARDSDRIGKEKTDRPMKGPGSQPGVSAMVGGISNLPGNPSEKGGKGGDVAGTTNPGYDKPAAYVEGGFRNRAMEHKRG